MSSALFVNEGLILAKVTDKSYKRGKGYYDWGMVESVVQRGNKPFAEVLGSEEDSYRVGIAFHEGEFNANCTCPYEWGGYCKHVVAVLLTWSLDRDLVTDRPPIEDLLAKLDADRLRALVLHMVGSDPGLSETVDEFCNQGLSPG